MFILILLGYVFVPVYMGMRAFFCFIESANLFIFIVM